MDKKTVDELKKYVQESIRPVALEAAKMAHATPGADVKSIATALLMQYVDALIYMDQANEVLLDALQKHLNWDK